MIADILTFNSMVGWSCGESYDSLVWNESEAGRAKPTEQELAQLKTSYDTAQIIKKLEAALDRHLDQVANKYRYESIRTMVTYATSQHPEFGVEGRAAMQFRDAAYAYAIQVMQDVENGLREIPSETELIAELPLFTDFLS